VRSAYFYRPSIAWSVGLSVGLSHIVSLAKTAKAIEMPFASNTLVSLGKHLLHIAERFGQIVYFVHLTQYSLLVYFYCCAASTLYEQINWLIDRSIDWLISSYIPHISVLLLFLYVYRLMLIHVSIIQPLCVLCFLLYYVVYNTVWHIIVILMSAYKWFASCVVDVK